MSDSGLMHPAPETALPDPADADNVVYQPSPDQLRAFSRDLECFLLNTGCLGDDSKDIGVDESVTLLRETARGTVEWTDSETIGLTVPQTVPGMDIQQFRVTDHVEDYEQKLQSLRAERREYLNKFEQLDETIRNTIH